ncbi:Peroxisome biosynthesis protein [Venturia nashicola]|uniref:ER membrane protein complex subunit 2 n=1 Tax=Venturia nashicola TaxID=86259 RepID=A0A4Z1PHZ4_9PEZI|nr:Peroxisome biosynthesis protein [Venturia nashicola]
MSVDLVHPPPNISPETALHISQQAPHIIDSSKSSLPWPLSMLSADETPDTWTQYENLYVSCLRTGDDTSARLILDKLVERFGESNERVMAYQGMWAEAKADSPAEIMEQVAKRRIALLRSIGKTAEATQLLVEFLQVSPTDAESWAELADLYFVQKAFEQAIFCLEEVLLILPNAWNIHARLAELVYLSTVSNSTGNTGDLLRGLSESMRRYCRSIELCNNFLRGYYGLKLTTKKLLEVLPTASKSALNTTSESAYSDLPLPSVKSVEKLNEVATVKLAEIVRRSAAKERGWDGYDEAEMIAARALLDKDDQKVTR